MTIAKSCILSGLAMTFLVNANAPLTGHWGGERANLTLDANGGRIDMDCAHGTIAAPMVMDKAGRFAAQGFLTRDMPGPIRMDAPDLRRSATYSGTLKSSALTLMIRIAGEPATQKLRLVKDTKVKLLRCL